MSEQYFALGNDNSPLTRLTVHWLKYCNKHKFTGTQMVESIGSIVATVASNSTDPITFYDGVIDVLLEARQDFSRVIDEV